jgi:hypothetical protein
MTGHVTDPAAADPFSHHGAHEHTGFRRRDPDFQALRSAHHELLRDFLCVMDDAGNPGLHRNLGSTFLQLVGQPTKHYWSTVLADGNGHHREVMVFDDYTHGWGDEMSYSDRPRNSEDEISADMLRTALNQILADQGLRWPEQARTRYLPAAEAEERETPREYFRHREVEYVWMMGVRILCVVVAVVLAALQVPYLPLWIALLGLGMVFLPMIAVMEANDHHPRRRRRHRWQLHAH